MKDLTPEHTKRRSLDDARACAEVAAAYSYVHSRVETHDHDTCYAPAWYGWALREAFLAGITYGNQNNEYRRIIDEVHAWIVCAAITSPEDMMQNAAHIEEITRIEP